jgi:AraC-like DNA-binding protein
MAVFKFPDSIICNQIDDLALPGLYACLYTSGRNSLKTKITLSTNIINLLIEGEKEVYFQENKIKIRSNQSIIIAKGNSLMTEKLSENNQFKSILIFFDNSKLTEFQLKHSLLLNKVKQPDKDSPYFIFEKDPYICNFIGSFESLFQKQAVISNNMLQVKIEELMLYLAETYTIEFLSFINCLNANSSEILFRKVVENNIFNNLSIEEIAFLCNMSLSTFKRKFASLYFTSPYKWFLQKKMERAKQMLQLASCNSSELHIQIGYDNEPSFINAFKRHFGKTPKEYVQEL